MTNTESQIWKARLAERIQNNTDQFPFKVFTMHPQGVNGGWFADGQYHGHFDTAGDKAAHWTRILIRKIDGGTIRCFSLKAGMTRITADTQIRRIPAVCRVTSRKGVDDVIEWLSSEEFAGEYE